MLIACSHSSGLICNGIFVPGPANTYERDASGQLIPDGKLRHGAYALKELAPEEEEPLLAWLEQNRTSPLVTNRVVVVADNYDDFRLKLMGG